MKFVSPLLVLFTMISAPNTYAEGDEHREIDTIEQESGVYEIGFILGTSDLSIDNKYAISQQNTSVESLSVGVEFWYRSPKKYLIQTSFTTTIDTDIFGISDNYQLYQWNTLIGYSFAITDRINLIPKIGFSRWELDAREGAFLNPGPELELEFTDTDFTYQVGIEFPIWGDLNMELAYENTKYRFGEIKIINLGLSFEF